MGSVETAEDPKSVARKLVSSPATHYMSPYQIIWDTRLTRGDRKVALKRWLSDEESSYWRDGDARHVAKMDLINNALRILRTEQV